MSWIVPPAAYIWINLQFVLFVQCCDADDDDDNDDDDNDDGDNDDDDNNDDQCL